MFSPPLILIQIRLTPPVNQVCDAVIMLKLPVLVKIEDELLPIIGWRYHIDVQLVYAVKTA
jgi:hypothetical protein